MQPPIPIGTILQNRYRLLDILGQGGFARTYLAEDQGRFNERCALKEFIPNQNSAYVIEKSRELFQREAAILYQIKHAQIPEFRATFEYTSDKAPRLFLVQDYVEGKTYRDLLNQRKAQGYTFSESEVRQLLQQVLPVLVYLHSKGIIHRDISPDNLILREPDHQPVLIDFGVVKEIVTRIQNLDRPSHATAVGKLGYAPSEQLQTGRAYPSSDLYSLAATAIVLLTGREPQDLFDDTTSTWKWQQWAAVSPGFARVLERMLQSRPSDRYQSVNDVIEALKSLPPPTVTPQKLPSPTGPLPANPSQIRTMAVDRPSLVVPRDPRADRVIPRPVTTPTSTSIWENPWMVGLIGTVLALLVGFTSWGVVRLLLQRRGQPSTPPVVTSPTPAPTPQAEPISYNRPLALLAGDTVSVQGTLKPNETINYVFQGKEGQQFQADLAGQGVLMALFGPDQAPIVQRVTSWGSTLPFTGDYYLQLKTIPEVSQSSYQLTTSLTDPTPPTPTPTPTPTPSETPSPEPSPQVTEIDRERVRFEEGENNQEISATIRPNQVKRYLVNAQEGQVLAAQVLDGSVTLNIRSPNGNLIENASEVLNWESILQSSGDYRVDVLTTEDTDFTINISVRD